ncbi:MAG: HAD-IIA family hydrolase [Persicimonas sp.]
MSAPPTLSVDDLFDRYEALLIDAYGVLVHTTGAFPGAVEFVDRLHETGMPYAVITNDASRLPESCVEKYRGDGLDIPLERVITSGSLVIEYIEEHGLVGADCLVLGTGDSRRYVERAGAHPVEAEAGDFDALIVCDESGFEFIPTVEGALTTLIRKFDAGESPHLVLPNPDLIYQRAVNSYGITSGSVAAIFERALRARYPGRDLTFERLGKPHAPMYERAVERVGTNNCAVLGDQLVTDIKGANDYGLDSVLVATGLTDTDNALAHSPVEPDYLLETLVDEDV